MTNSSLANVSIDKSVVESIISTQMEAALLAALGNDNTKAMVLDGIVKAALNDKVDFRGVKSRYNSDNEYQWLTVKTRQLIQNITEKVFEEWIEDKQEMIAQQVREAMESQAHEISNGLVRSLLENAKTGYRTRVNVELNPIDREDY